MSGTAIRFQLGARTLFTITRRLEPVVLDLAAVLAAELPALPPLAGAQHGYLVTSLPVPSMAALARAAPGLIFHPRQAYIRYHADLTLGWDGYLARLSANTRASIRRKTKRFAEAGGGTPDIRLYRTPQEMAQFHALARPISMLTYQERLLDSGLSADPARMLAQAAQDRARGWILFLAGRPIAYLYCPAQGDALVYDRVGHDPAHGDLSPGVVLQAEAMRMMIDEGAFARFDFTAGDGQHKRAFATGGTPCVDLLLLRPGLANRATVAALDRFDRAMAWGKRASASAMFKPVTRRLRRA